MAYWLMKSEPDAFSIEDLARQKVAGWDGVRNYQARKNLRAMKIGDQAFFFRSSAKPTAIVGLMEVIKEAYPDPTQFDPKNPHFEAASTPQNPRWFQVDVKFLKAYGQPLTTEQIRGIPALKDMVLLHNTRLSVQPVSPQEWKILLPHLS